MPLAYGAAPLVVDNEGRSDVPGLAALTAAVRRTTPVARFASAFRSRRLPVAGVDGAELLSTYLRFREGGAQVASRYYDAMPYRPPMLVADREARYEFLKARAEASQ